MKAHLHILNPPHLQICLNQIVWDTPSNWADQDRFSSNISLICKLLNFTRTTRLALEIDILRKKPGSRSCFLRCPWMQGRRPHCATATCSASTEGGASEWWEKNLDRRGSQWEKNGCESCVTQCSTGCCLSYQPLSRIWCVISPLIMPLILQTLQQYKFSQKVQEKSMADILHLSLLSCPQTLRGCTSVTPCYV